jgi:hypothetical protein
MRVFIVRPFRVKEAVDFERVETDLIQPALKALRQQGIEITGGTTGEISRQGNIREDMFRLIVVSDLVIADVSIHNANVFYELGIRHALRPRHTFLMRSEVPKHDYPFDLQTDRYFLYDSAKPGDKVADMTEALRSTLSSDERDSPIFQLLPKLTPHGRGDLIKIPTTFQEDVTLALNSGLLGDLRLYASEVAGLEWDQEGLRVIGDAQFKLRAFAGARDTFELLRQAAQDSFHANQRLATIYQRLTLTCPPGGKEDLLTRSDQAIGRVEALAITPADKAERYALLGSNAKSRWIDDFKSDTPDERGRRALQSAYLPKMLDYYLKAANQDLNAHYPAVNALAMLKIQIALARRYPDVWKGNCGTKAKSQLKAREELAERLIAALHLALQMDEIAGRREGPPDPWAVSSRADLILLTNSDDPDFVANEYRQATNGADRFTLEANRRNLGIYQALGLFEPGVTAALKVIDELMTTLQKSAALPSQVLLFSGHMVDAPDRPADKVRFPPTARAEQTARALIKDAVSKEAAGHEGAIVGIAGGACGSDILFHEVCAELGIPTEVYLALPQNDYQKESVARGGPVWIGRFQVLCERHPPHILQQNKPLPRWLTDKPQYDVWQRNNLRMLFSALATGALRKTFIALFNPEREPDGPGGTKHLVEEAANRGFKPVPLDARSLLT